MFVAERRENGSWLRVLTLPRASVRSVDRRLPAPAVDAWVAEDVRTSAGLSSPHAAVDEEFPAKPRRRSRMRLPRTKRLEGRS
ncbi:MAG: hypothetical protein WD794_13130 [Mycobacteriales bacterium]